MHLALRPEIDAATIMRNFELGEPTFGFEPLEVAGDSRHVFSMRTSEGNFVIKITKADTAWQRRSMERACRLEKAALEIGVAMPRPIEPLEPAIGYWTRIDDERYLRVHERVQGVHTTMPAPEPVAAWLGTTMATIERLNIEDLEADDSYPLHSIDMWEDWLREARVENERVAAGMTEALGFINIATQTVERALRAGPTTVLSHRDMSAANILVTAKGPVLLDWDFAGPEVPWWEAVQTAFTIAGAGRSTGEVGRACLRATFDAYVDAGGTPGEGDMTAFAGLLRSALGWTAYNVWLSMGHRDADPNTRARATRIALDQFAALPRIMRSLQDWTHLLPQNA